MEPEQGAAVHLTTSILRYYCRTDTSAASSAENQRKKARQGVVSQSKWRFSLNEF